MFDCDDGSDEFHCDPIEIDKKSYRKILPPVPTLGKKSIILVSMEIREIYDIDEILMKFHGEVKIVLQWKDSRLTFKNLANEGNFLEEFWQDQIWLPPITYSNTENDGKISLTDDIIVEILRQGIGTPNPVTELDEV